MGMNEISVHKLQIYRPNFFSPALNHAINSTYRQKVRAKSAFTLLELLLTIALVGIILGVSIPSLNRSIKNTKFRSFVDKTYLFLDYAKNHAVLKSVILQMRFDQEENQIFLEERETKQRVLRTVKIPEKMSFEIKEEEINFYPDGTLQKFEIIIYDEDDDSNRRIKISSKGFDGKIVVNREE